MKTSSELIVKFIREYKINGRVAAKILGYKVGHFWQKLGGSRRYGVFRALDLPTLKIGYYNFLVKKSSVLEKELTTDAKK